MRRDFSIVADTYDAVAARPNQDYLLIGLPEHSTQDVFFIHAIEEDLRKNHDIWNIIFQGMRNALPGKDPIIIPLLGQSYGENDARLQAMHFHDAYISPVAYRAPFLDDRLWQIYDNSLRPTEKRVIRVPQTATGDLGRMILNVRTAIDSEVFSL